ncbi:uncharacterized protein LOC132555229 [Ylistrum balloti]|uniref:uncharacterized protein LOC132555229 n=1 Tax=Ylistrum balloti TaxID=509963 RepID=UPI002905BFF9|nr:uncharacterized protein LOC132555229 [Ylistrum balloti]
MLTKNKILTLALFSMLVFFCIDDTLKVKQLLKDPRPLLFSVFQQETNWAEYYDDIFRKYNIPVMKKAFPKVPCDAKNTTLTENMDIVSKYQFTVPQKYLQRLSLDQNGIDRLSKAVLNPAKYPIFVTAASSNHYGESIAMINNYHKLLNVHPELKMIYFDIGLSAEQHKKMKLYCKCEMRSFDFDLYPKHTKEKMGYTWKPIIVQTVLKDHDFVFWMDASVRFNGRPLDELRRLARERGLQFIPGSGAVMQRTSKLTFDFFKEKPCVFNFPETTATTFVISRNRFTLEYFMKPWVSCARTS